MEALGLSREAGDSTLPQDHEDQLQLGVRIITTAFQNKMHTLEQEIRRLRTTCEEQRSNVAGLKKRNGALEVELVEGHQRTQQLAEENKELSKNVAYLQKQIKRLEGLKQAVLTSLQDDQEKEAEFGDTRMIMSEDFMRGATPLTAAEMGYGSSRAPALQQLPVPGVVPQAQPSIFDSASATPPAGGPAGSVVDGKAFFRKARRDLSYEAFNLFLASIKRLNHRQQTREETLEEARQIFGTELADLYKDFENLLNRHGM